VLQLNKLIGKKVRYDAHMFKKSLNFFYQKYKSSLRAKTKTTRAVVFAVNILTMC